MKEKLLKKVLNEKEIELQMEKALDKIPFEIKKIKFALGVIKRIKKVKMILNLSRGIMISEKLVKRIGTISREFEKLGYNLEEDLLELAEMREDIAERLENTKYKKIEFYEDKELHSVGMTLEDVQIEFFITEEKMKRDLGMKLKLK